MQTHRQHGLVMVRRVICGVVVASVAGLAAAQTQTGNALDRDLMRVRTGPGQPSASSQAYSTSARDIVQEVRLRNAIVTGNAPGGLSFRGNVGYTAPDDFRGSLGSDDTFAFRRDSLPSGVGGMGFRGTESLQYQFAYTTGSSTPTLYSTRLEGSSARLPSAVSGRTSVAENPALARANAVDSGWTTSAANMGTLRSVSAFQSSRLLSPSVVGYRPTFAGLERTSASPLLGVRTVTLGTGLLGDRPVEAPRPNAAGSPGPSNAVTPNNAAPTAAPSTAAPGGSAALPAGETPALVAQPNRDVEQKSVGDVFDQTRTRLRDQVRSTTPTRGVEPSERPGDAPAGQPEVPGAQAEDPYEARMATLRGLLDPNQRRRTVEVDPQTPDNELTPEQRAARATAQGKMAGLDEELLAILRDAKVTTSTLLLVDPQSQDAIDAQMMRGQQLIGQERYFDAEEQFARVISFRPGDTAALIGRAHAQLGAGLFLSSALNLREVFSNQPETMAVRYQHPAIPDEERLRVLVERLRANLQRGRAMNESALLIAYIGHQLDSAALRKEGLEAMRAVDLTDPLPDVLERVWAE